MSLTTTSRHPQAEPSPPTSPNSALDHINPQGKPAAAKHLPESPPASASPSPAHVISQQSSNESFSTQTMAQSTTSTVSSNLAAPKPHAPPSELRGESSLSRTSSKHRLDDEEDLTQQSNKRRRTDHDRNESQETAAVAKDGSETLSLAPLYRLSDQPVPRSRPHPTQDLFDLYNLNPLADTVRRKDPVTGEKINKLRKSYESKIKEFSGKNKPVENENEFFYLLNYPDEEWGVTHHNGKEISQALSADRQQFSDDMRRTVDAALSGISRNTLRPTEKEKWRSTLGLESLAPKVKTPDVQAHSRQPPPAATMQTIPEGGRRTKRRGTKRNYNDEAFEGYNEGFVDDDLDLSGDGDDDRRSSLSTGSRKKRRKVRFAETPESSSPPPTPTKPPRKKAQARRLSK